MHIDPWILSFSAVTVLVTVWMGFRSAKTSKTASDFFVAGRSVGVGMNASAISGEYLSAASFMGVAGMVMSSGYDALWYPVCYACGYLFLLLFIAGPLRRFGAYTIPDFAEGRFDSPLFRKIAVVFVLCIGFFYTMPQMKGAGTTLAYIFQDLDFRGTALAFLAPHEKGEALKGLHYGVGVFLVGAVITLNVALGGMKGITLVQAFQYWAKMFAISVPIFVLMAVYGHYGKQLETQAARTRSTNVHAVVILSAFKAAGLPEPDWVDEWNRRLGDIKEKITDVADSLSGIEVVPASGTVTSAMRDMLVHFAERERKMVLVESSVTNVWTATALRISYGTNTGDFAKQLGLALTTNGIQLLTVGNAFVAAPTNRVREVQQLINEQGLSGLIPGDSGAVNRQPLPAKAPRDETWHNPFGPLTTKAASAANAVPRWSLSPEARGKLVDYVGRPAPSALESVAKSMEQFAKRLGSGSTNKPRASNFALFVNMATNATQSIPGGLPMLSALHELGLLLNRPVLVTTNLPRPKPVISGSFQSQEQFVKYFESLLLTNGVRLDLGGADIKAMPASDWERYQKSQSSLSFVPNRIFAMRVGPHEERQPDGSMILRHSEPRILLASYGDVLGKRALMAASLPTNGVDFNPTFEVMLAHEAKARMEATLLERGITIIPAGDQEVWAVPTVDLPRYKLPPVNPRPLSLLYTYSLIIALVCGTAGLPHILVRFYTNPDGVAAKRTTMWVMILIGVFYLFPPVFGVMGRNLMPSLYEGAGAKGTDKVVLELPRLLNEQGSGGEKEQRREGAEGRGGEIPSAPLPPGSSAAAPATTASQRFPWGSILSGITCAGAFAAFMSTFSGLLVSMTGALAHDVYGRIFRPKSTPEQRLRMFKLCTVIVGGGAMLLGFLVESFEINKMVGWAFAIAATSYFPLLFLSTWWRGITMKGAATGMLVGGTTSLLAIASTMFADEAKWAAGLKAWYATHPLWRILAEQPAIWALPLAMGLMFVISKLTAKDVPADVRMKMLVLHAPEKLGLKQEYIQEHQPGH